MNTLLQGSDRLRDAFAEADFAVHHGGKRANVLGVGVSAVNMEEALRACDELIASEGRGYVCVTGVHGVMEAQRDLVTVLGQFDPKLVKMAPSGERPED